MQETKHSTENREKVIDSLFIKSVKIRKPIHKKLKELSLKKEISILDVLDKILTQFFLREEQPIPNSKAGGERQNE